MEVIACRIPGVSKKRSGIYKGDQQKSHMNWGSSLFGWKISRGVTHFYGSSLAMAFEFSRISKTTLTSMEYLRRHSSNTLLVFLSGADY